MAFFFLVIFLVQSIRGSPEKEKVVISNVPFFPPHMMPLPPMDQYGQPPAFYRGPMGIQHTQVIINNFGEERGADWDDHHYGEQSDNGDSDCLNKTDLTSVHTHDEEHAQTEAADGNSAAEPAEENEYANDAYADSDEDHPEMLDKPSADHDSDLVD